MGVACHRYTRPSSEICLSAEERRICAQVWNKAKQRGSGQPARAIFREFQVFQRSIDIELILNVNSSVLHEKRFSLAMDSIIASIQKPEGAAEIIKFLKELGGKHAAVAESHGFEPHLWDVFAGAVRDATLVSARCEEDTRAIDAMHRLMGIVIRCMKQGYALELQKLTCDVNYRDSKAAHEKYDEAVPGEESKT